MEQNLLFDILKKARQYKAEGKLDLASQLYLEALSLNPANQEA